jgi:hypothetical protein
VFVRGMANHQPSPRAGPDVLKDAGIVTGAEFKRVFGGK